MPLIEEKIHLPLPKNMFINQIEPRLSMGMHFNSNTSSHFQHQIAPFVPNIANEYTSTNSVALFQNEFSNSHISSVQKSREIPSQEPLSEMSFLEPAQNSSQYLPSLKSLHVEPSFAQHGVSPINLSSIQPSNTLSSKTSQYITTLKSLQSKFSVVETTQTQNDFNNDELVHQNRLDPHYLNQSTSQLINQKVNVNTQIINEQVKSNISNMQFEFQERRKRTYKSWTNDEILQLESLTCGISHPPWKKIAHYFPGRSPAQIKMQYRRVIRVKSAV